MGKHHAERTIKARPTTRNVKRLKAKRWLANIMRANIDDVPNVHIARNFLTSGEFRICRAVVKM